MPNKPPSGIATPPGEPAPPSAYLRHRYRSPRPPFDYTILIKDSLRLAWRHKFLWFFGLFAGGSTTTLGWPSGFPGNFSVGDENVSPDSAELAQDVGRWVGDHLTLIIGALAVVGALGFAAWLWSIVCRGAVIGSVKDISEGNPSGMRAAFARGRQGFVRLLQFDLLLLAILIGFFIITAAAVTLIVFLALSLGTAGETTAIVLISLAGFWLLGMMAVTLGYLAIFSIWFVWWVPVILLVIYATRAVVLELSGPVEALRRAWHLMVETITRTLLLFLLSTGLGIAGGIGAFMITAVTAIPAVVAWASVAINDWPVAGIAVSIALSLLPAAALVLAAALINTYFTSFWTLAYLRLRGREKESAGVSAAA